ncbi:MAG: Fic family protein [Acidimicrobiia bacterium]
MIHPFVDGNGRVGRLLLQQLLRRRLKLPSPVPVSVVWSRAIDRYIAGLRSYQSGDIDSWLEFFAFSVIESVDWMADIRADPGVCSVSCATGSTPGESR